VQHTQWIVERHLHDNILSQNEQHVVEEDIHLLSMCAAGVRLVTKKIALLFEYRLKATKDRSDPSHHGSFQHQPITATTINNNTSEPHTMA